MSDYETALAIVRRLEQGVPAHREATHAEFMALVRSWVEIHDALLALTEMQKAQGEASMALGEPRRR